MLDRASEYVASQVALELNGEFMGVVSAARGGEVFADVLTETDASGSIRKRPGPARFAPIVIDAGPYLAGPLYEWVAAAVRGGVSPRDGALVLCDRDGRERLRLEFVQGVITEVGLPVVDAAMKRDATVTITIKPAATRRRRASGQQFYLPGPGRDHLQWLSNHFRLEIGGAQVLRATRVEPIIVSCADRSVSISNVIFTTPENDAQPWYAWLDDFVVAGHNDPSQERIGELELLDPSLSRSVLTIALSKLGIVRVANVVSKSDAAVISRVAVEMYCGAVAIQVPGALPKPTGSTRATAPSAAEGEALASRLHELVSSLGGETAHLSGRALAARLLSSTMLSTQDSVGGSWAREHATLGELQMVAGIHGEEWSALVLPAEHSLVGFLHAAGLLVTPVGNPVIIERDSTIEAVVAAAAGVYQEASPYLTTVGAASDVEAKVASRPFKFTSPKIT